MVFALYPLVYRNLNTRNYYLLLLSLYFYYLSSGYYFTLLIISTFIDFYIGRAIYRSDQASRRKFLVTLSVCCNLLILGYFKYTYFFTDTFNQIFQANLQSHNPLASFLNLFPGVAMDVSKIFLPVGISFYTFQTISYSIDIYRGQLQPTRNILDFAFYVSFFPQLVAGPIVRAHDFIPQIYQPYSLDERAFGKAIFLIMAGLVKKIVISDFLSVNFVDRVFGAPESFPGLVNLLGVYGYAMQIYCDFSGYTDIAIGVALLLGYRLPLNFNSPYKANTITDFWRRWHISLSSWLRDYLYIPLGGNRLGRVRTYINLSLTMLLGGLWHGAHIKFIIWGALHGLALALHKLWMEATGNTKDHSWYGNFFSGVLTFHFVCLCWIFFRADSLNNALLMIGQIITNFNANLLPDVATAYQDILLLMAAGYGFHYLPARWKEWSEEKFSAQPDFVKAFSVIVVLILIFQFHQSGMQPFIYFQF